MNREAPFLSCSDFGPTPPSISAAFRSGRLGDIAKAGWFPVAHTIGRIIQPRALYAVDLAPVQHERVQPVRASCGRRACR